MKEGDARGPDEPQPAFARRLGIVVSAPAFAATLLFWRAGGGSLDLEWAPTLGLRLSFALDGLAALYVLLATGIGFAVFVYSTAYLPVHLHHQRRSRAEETRFYGFLLLFMVSMVGLVTAQDLVLLFVFWDLTAISSYFLIGYDRHDEKDRYAALMALLVTGVSAVFLLIGALLLYEAYGTFSLPEIFARAEPGAQLTAAVALIVLAGLAKSAQFPFHFWLPRAMVAPTPVSAYLHSAAMVAAGVFLIGRVYPLLAESPLVLDGLVVVGALSMAVGGLLALTRDALKEVLAYSTIAQYGYVVFLFGLGTPAAVLAATLYVLVHALVKSALFLTAGAVTIASGENRLSELGGFLRPQPVLAVASGVAAAGLAALPVTAGFFADELFFAAARARGAAFGVVAVASAALTLAYIARFWAGIFLGTPRGRSRPAAPALVAPVLVLALLVAAGGILAEPLARLGAAAASVSAQEPLRADLAYHLGARAENLMALAAYAGGALVLASRRRWREAAFSAVHAGARLGPERWYHAGLEALNSLSDRIHDFEVRDLRTRVAAVLVPAGLLVAIGIWATPTAGAYALGRMGSDDVALALVLVAVAVAALATTLPRRHLTLVLVLSTLGFSLAVVYAFLGGPDVALVAVLVETIFALLFLGVFALLPRRVLVREAALPTSRRRRWRDPLVGLVSGAAAFFVVWGALSRPALTESVAVEHVRLAPEAHAKDVVTAILADFRGLDTLGEVTVVAIALVGIAAVLRRGRMS